MSLPLDDPRWGTLKSHFAGAEDEAAHLADVPALVARWARALGTYAEEYAYDDLCEAYLHQRTILDVAYAVVPHLAARLPELEPDRRLEVLDDVSIVEEVRLCPPEEVEATIAQMRETLPDSMKEMMIQQTRDRYPPLPDDLAREYLEAIRDAQRATLALVAATRDGEAFRLVLSTLSRLHGQCRFGDVLDNLDQLDVSKQIEKWAAGRRPSPRHWRRHVAFLQGAGWTRDDVRVGFEVLTRSDGESDALVYLGREGAREGLRDRAPEAWLARTKIHAPEGALAFKALHAVAWSSRRADLGLILADFP